MIDAAPRPLSSTVDHWSTALPLAMMDPSNPSEHDAAIGATLAAPAPKEAFPGKLDLQALANSGPLPRDGHVKNNERSSSSPHIDINPAVDPLFARKDRTISLPGVPPKSPSPKSPPRKLSRKLPPELTESLEQLAASDSSSQDSHEKTTPVFSVRELVARSLPSPGMPAARSLDSPSSSEQTPRSSLSTAPASPPRPARHPARSTSSISPVVPRRGSAESDATITTMPGLFYTPASRTSSSAPSTSIRTPRSTHFHRSSISEAPSCSSGSASTCGTWSAIDDLEQYETAFAAQTPAAKLTRKQKKLLKKQQEALFNESEPPSMKSLFEASLLEVVDERGERVKFGDLVRTRRTIVVFIRHWFCPLCAQYINSILSQVSPEALEEADVDLIIIGNGSSKMINGYRNKHFKCPFKMYTDPTLALYRTLGLTRQTGDGGADEDAGDYLIQSAMESTMQTLKRATQMPLRNPGHFMQLGGEFIFESTLHVTYTHRMLTTRDHAPIRDVCYRAGVELEHIHYERGSPPPDVHRMEPLEEEAEEPERVEWQEDRDWELQRMQDLKSIRRQGMIIPVGDVVRIVGEDDSDLSSLEERSGGMGVAF